jgi:hypothetical protein
LIEERLGACFGEPVEQGPIEQATQSLEGRFVGASKDHFDEAGPEGL